MGIHLSLITISLDYHVMFYRQDILDELSLKLPQTWDDLYAMIPIIQRNNMAVGLPSVSYTHLSKYFSANYLINPVINENFRNL